MPSNMSSSSQPTNNSPSFVTPPVSNSSSDNAFHTNPLPRIPSQNNNSNTNYSEPSRILKTPDYSNIHDGEKDCKEEEKNASVTPNRQWSLNSLSESPCKEIIDLLDILPELKQKWGHNVVKALTAIGFANLLRETEMFTRNSTLYRCDFDAFWSFFRQESVPADSGPPSDAIKKILHDNALEIVIHQFHKNLAGAFRAYLIRAFPNVALALHKVDFTTLSVSWAIIMFSLHSGCKFWNEENVQSPHDAIHKVFTNVLSGSRVRTPSHHKESESTHSMLHKSSPPNDDTTTENGSSESDNSSESDGNDESPTYRPDFLPSDMILEELLLQSLVYRNSEMTITSRAVSLLYGYNGTRYWKPSSRITRYVEKPSSYGKKLKVRSGKAGKLSLFVLSEVLETYGDPVAVTRSKLDVLCEVAKKENAVEIPLRKVKRRRQDTEVNNTASDTSSMTVIRRLKRRRHNPDSEAFAGAETRPHSKHSDSLHTIVPRQRSQQNTPNDGSPRHAASIAKASLDIGAPPPLPSMRHSDSSTPLTAAECRKRIKELKMQRERIVNQIQILEGTCDNLTKLQSL